jgi:hypothetical protein
MQDDQSLFSLTIDPETKLHLSDAAKWARFLAITGLALLAIFAVINIWGLALSNGLRPSSDEFGGSAMLTQFGLIMIVVSIITIVILFFPLFFLLKFSGNLKTALAANNQESLVEAFLNMKRYFRFLGILVLIIIVFYLLMFIIMSGMILR